MLVRQSEATRVTVIVAHDCVKVTEVAAVFSLTKTQGSCVSQIVVRLVGSCAVSLQLY